MSSVLIDQAIAAYDNLTGDRERIKELYAEAEEGEYGLATYSDADEAAADLYRNYGDILDTLIAAIKADRLRHEVLEVHLYGECDDAAVED